MSDVTLKRRIAALVGIAFPSVMGATAAAATIADSPTPSSQRTYPAHFPDIELADEHV